VKAKYNPILAVGGELLFGVFPGTAHRREHTRCSRSAPKKANPCSGSPKTAEKFNWKIPIKWILKICIGDPTYKKLTRKSLKEFKIEKALN
jgi:hypothetical protein